MRRAIAISVLFLLVAAYPAVKVPKKLWIRHMEKRLALITEQDKQCGEDLGCRARVEFELQLFNHDVQNPPWYVVGAGQGPTGTAF